MKRNVLSLCAGIAMAGSFVAAQAPQEPAASAPAVVSAPAAPQADQARQSARPAADVTLTGCLVQGSSPTVYILENARSGAAESSSMAGASAEAKGLSYLVSATATTVDLKSQINHQVSVTGTTEKAAASVAASPSGEASASADRKMSEKDLPKLSAKTVIKIGDTCAAAD
jgi:hypothetical protein